MKAIQVEGQELSWSDAPEPTLGVGEVLIANKATALNRADLAQRARTPRPPLLELWRMERGGMGDGSLFVGAARCV